MKNAPFISICIPSYEASGMGVKLVEANIVSCLTQTYKNIEIIISDHSQNNDIERFCLSIQDSRIRYIRNVNNVGAPVHNTNNAIHYSRGSHIKIQNLDDIFLHDSVLEESVSALNEGAKWIIYTYVNYDVHELHNNQQTISGLPCKPKHPINTTDLLLGINTIGSPSCALFPAGFLMDINVEYMIDCELYYQLYSTIGPPTIINTPSIGQGVGAHQLSHVWKDKYQRMMEQDIDYCFKKYNLK